MAEVSTQTVVDGRYRIVDRIGSGGMGDVYRAEDTHLHRDVALKVLHRRFARDEQFVERFRREAKSAASLQHPNVVAVYDRGQHDGTYYIAMEHLEGRTLKELAAEEAPLAQERAIDIGIQILQAAAFAHSRGVVHRDFKPQNVIVGAGDDVKVTDFGIARAGASDITETGSILGTAQYLSPEQAQGGAVEAPSDIYSIGVILYELLAGRLPFEGEGAVAVAVKHLTEEPPRLRDLRPDIHPGLEAAVMKALAKDPAQRWSSAAEFVSALQAARAQIALGEEGQGTAVWAPLPVDGMPPVDGDDGAPRRRRRRWLWLLLPLLLAAGVVAFLLLRGPPQVPVPDVLGEQLADAQAELEGAGFRVESEQRANQADINEVIEQEPPAGEEIDEGATVTLIVSSGAPIVRIPNVEDLPEQEALDKLERRGFKAETDRQFSTDVAEGLVISTLPAAGAQRPRGSTVQVLVSDGPRQVTVPGVIGESSDVARVELQNVGLVVVETKVESGAPRGEVVSQEPSAGTVVDEGTEVTLGVSSGPPAPDPEPETVSVPGVTGLSESAASSQIQAAGLSVAAQDQATTDQSQDGVVVSQDPGGGAEVEPGTTVTIVVGRFEAPPPVEPPEEEPPGGQPPPEEPPGEEPPLGGPPGRKLGASVSSSGR